MARPAFLLGTVPLYLVGVAAALHGGYDLRPLEAFVGLVLVLTVQAMTHYANEYWDVAIDAAAEEPTRITGGSRVLVTEVVPRETARVAAIVCLSVALLLVLAIVVVGDAGTTFVLIVGIAILGGWFYSSPPLSFVSRGVGEIAVAVIVAFLVPTVGYLLQVGSPDPVLGYVCLPLLPLAFAVALSTALPDVEPDRAGGKLTLATRIGREEVIALVALSLVLGWTLFGTVTTALHPVFAPLAFAAFIPLFVVYGRAASTAAGGSPMAAERLALVAIVALGWASVATVLLLLLDASLLSTFRSFSPQLSFSSVGL